jgi:hypothetical protein
MPSHGKMGSRELTTAPKARETGAAAREGIGPGQSAAAPSSSTSSARLDARIPAARALPRAPSSIYPRQSHRFPYYIRESLSPSS